MTPINFDLIKQLTAASVALPPEVASKAEEANTLACSSAGDCYMPPPAAAPGITHATATKEAIIVLGDLLKGEDVSILDALQRLELNAKELPLEKISPFEMVVLILIEILRTKPQLADKVKNIIIQIIVDGPYPFEEKVSIMTKLARIHNQADTTDVQKGAIIAVFEAAREGVKKDAFLAGLITVRQLNDQDKDETKRYLSTFAAHAHQETEIGMDTELQAEYIDALKDYAKVQSKYMLPVMEEITSYWFDNLNARILWNALMTLSELNLKCELTSNTGEPVLVPFKEALLALFNAYFYNEDLPDQRRITITDKVIGNLDYNTPYFPTDQFVPALHVKIIEDIIKKGKTEIKQAVLNALLTKQMIRFSKEKSDKERAIATAYFRLIAGELREKAIEQATGKDDLHHQMLKFMIDDETKWDNPGRFLRDSTHALITDGSPYYDKSFIVTHGIPLLEEGAVEAVTDKAPSGEIGNQCEETLKTLYEARYIRNPLWDLSLNLSVQPANSFAGDRIERDPGTLGIRFDWMGPEWDMFRWRTLFGGEISRGLAAQSASVMVGTGRLFQDVIKGLFVKSFSFVGWLNMFNKDDDSTAIPLGIGPKDTEPYDAKVINPDIDIHAAQAGIGLQLGMDILTKRLGLGRQFRLRVFVESRGSLWAGVISDDGCNYALDPKGFTGSNGNLSTDTKFSQRCRDNDGIAGYALTGTIGVTGEF